MHWLNLLFILFSVQRRRRTKRRKIPKEEKKRKVKVRADR